MADRDYNSGYQSNYRGGGRGGRGGGRGRGRGGNNNFRGGGRGGRGGGGEFNGEFKNRPCLKCDEHWVHETDECPHGPQVCRNRYSEDGCRYGSRCRRGHINYINHPRETLQPLTNTVSGTHHSVNFRCVICDTLIVRAEKVRRINQNCIWVSQVEDGTLNIGEYRAANPYKGDYYVHVRCSSCNSLLGWKYEGQDRAQNPFKLGFISRGAGNHNWMRMEAPAGSIDDALSTHTPLSTETGEDQDSRPWPRNGRDESGEFLKTKKDTEALMAAKTDITDVEFLTSKLRELDFRSDMTKYKQELKKQPPEEDKKDDH